MYNYALKLMYNIIILAKFGQNNVSKSRVKAIMKAECKEES